MNQPKNQGDAVRRSVVAPAPVEEAFTTFTEGMTAWWPRANTFGRQTYESVHMEPRPGGRWFERSTAGDEKLWGRVQAWEPSRRVVLTWQISPEGLPEPDPDKASLVEVRFTPEGPESTRVDIEHREFERHGEPGAAIWREGMASDQGWSNLLAQYLATFRNTGGER